MRKEYDGFPGYPLHPLARQIHAVEMLSGKPVAAVTINHELMPTEKVPLVCDAVTQVTGLPAVDVLYSGAGELANILAPYLEKRKKRER